MTPLRTLALAAALGGIPVALHADSILAGTPVPTVSSAPAADAASLYAITSYLSAARQPELAPATRQNVIFPSAPVAVGDSNWSLHPYAITDDSVESTAIYPDPEPRKDDGKPAPEPAGLFLLGTGAFATALSIRYRLFSL